MGQKLRVTQIEVKGVYNNWKTYLHLIFQNERNLRFEKERAAFHRKEYS